MTATITDRYKQLILEDLWNSFYNNRVDSAGDSDRYYIGISRSEDWPDETSPPTPYPDKETIATFQNSLQAIKRVDDLSYVIPRHNWSAGSIYTAFRNSNHSETTIGAIRDIDGPYYVITDEQNVYVCLLQGKTDAGVTRTSIYKPTDVSHLPFAAGPDGYVWKFMYNVGVYNSRRYLTSEWMPVERILDSSQGGPSLASLSASRLLQYVNQDRSVKGEILAIEVDSTGVGYDSNTTSILIYGDNDIPAKAYPRIDENGKIFQVVMKDSAGQTGYSLGGGYTEKTWIEVSGGGGSGAVLKPVVHLDSSGLGFDPRKDLNASALMYSVRLIGEENEIFNTRNEFRQVGLILNPDKDSANKTGFTADPTLTAVRANALKKIYVDAGIDPLNTDLDNTVTGLTSGAKAVLGYYKTYIDSDCCDSTNNASHNVLYVHQNQTTGFKPFSHGEAVELSDGGGTASIISHADSDIPAMRYASVDNYTGKVLFVDNRVNIERDEDQTEDIKLIIDL